MSAQDWMEVAAIARSYLTLQALQDVVADARNLTLAELLEAGSAALTIAGALLLATKCRWAGWAFVIWLAANVGWIAFGLANGHKYLVAQHMVLACTSLVGIWKWLAHPVLERRVSAWRCEHCGRGLTNVAGECAYPDCEYFRKGHGS